jgi:hypothetical protein
MNAGGSRSAERSRRKAWISGRLPPGTLSVSICHQAAAPRSADSRSSVTADPGGRAGINKIHGDNGFADNGEPAAAGPTGRHARIIDIRNFDKRHEFFETLTPCRRHK